MINQEAYIRLAQRIVDLEEGACTTNLAEYANDPKNAEFFNTLEKLSADTNQGKTTMITVILGAILLDLVAIKEIK